MLFLKYSKLLLIIEYLAKHSVNPSLIFIFFAIAIFLSSIILGFLTIKENFITTFLMSTLLCIGVFFLMEGFMPGFKIEVYTFEGLNTGNLVVNPFEVTKILTMVFASTSYAFITSILNVLEKTS